MPGVGEPLDEATAAVAGLRQSYLTVQGPPGTGKTYTGSHLIVDLLDNGCRVGVCSNSHYAVNNLLDAVEDVAEEKGVRFTGVKKGNGDKDRLNGRIIEDVTTNKAVVESDAQLVGGTAWLFANPALDQAFEGTVGHIAALFAMTD